MIKVGIIGCGKIADLHVAQIKKILGCQIVAVCDREALMAKQLYERYQIPYYFDDVKTLLDSTKPDIIHITTPPQSHFKLGKLCLEAGCNVYIEKPFTLTTEEAKQLIESAVKKNLKITVGHNAQFSPVAIRMRDLINRTVVLHYFPICVQ